MQYTFYDPNGFRCCCCKTDKELSPKWRHMLIRMGKAIPPSGVVVGNYGNI